MMDFKMFWNVKIDFFNHSQIDEQLQLITAGIIPPLHFVNTHLKCPEQQTDKMLLVKYT